VPVQGHGHRLNLGRAQEFNSVEAIKGAVQNGLGAAFVSTAAIAKELELRLLARVVRPCRPCARLRKHAALLLQVSAGMLSPCVPGGQMSCSESAVLVRVVRM